MEIEVIDDPAPPGAEHPFAVGVVDADPGGFLVLATTICELLGEGVEDGLPPRLQAQGDQLRLCGRIEPAGVVSKVPHGHVLARSASHRPQRAEIS